MCQWGWVLVKALFLTYRWPPSFSSHVRERDLMPLPFFFSFKSTNTNTRATLSWPQLNIIISQGIISKYYHIWEVRASVCFGGAYFDPWQYAIYTIFTSKLSEGLVFMRHMWINLYIHHLNGEGIACAGFIYWLGCTCQEGTCSCLQGLLSSRASLYYVASLWKSVTQLFFLASCVVHLVPFFILIHLPCG